MKRIALSVLLILAGCSGEPSASMGSKTPDKSTVVTSSADIHSQFAAPPTKYGPHAWWHWMNGDVNPEQAVADLTWLSEQGIAGVQLFDAGMGPAPDSPLTFGSDAWRDAVKLSAGTAQSLGMDFVITTSPGWSATGGPWVTQEQAMKKWVRKRSKRP